MRSSPLKHPLAVLRTALGLGQKQLADELGCSRRTIQAIELLDLELSTKLAEGICRETGVHFNWLMGRDPEAPIIDERGRSWRRENYFDAQGRKLFPKAVPGRDYSIQVLNVALAKLCAAVVATAGSRSVRSYTWRLTSGIDSAVDDLKAYPDLVHEFNQILVDNMSDTKVAREKMLACAVRRIKGRAKS